MIEGIFLKGTTSLFCENLDPDGEFKCTRFDEHTGPCAYESDGLIMQWQMEDSFNYRRSDNEY